MQCPHFGPSHYHLLGGFADVFCGSRRRPCVRHLGLLSRLVVLRGLQKAANLVDDSPSVEREEKRDSYDTHHRASSNLDFQAKFVKRKRDPKLDPKIF